MKHSTEKVYQALNLLNLVKHHQKTCNEADCGVSLSATRPLYESLIERSLTKEESRWFI